MESSPAPLSPFTVLDFVIFRLNTTKSSCDIYLYVEDVSEFLTTASVKPFAVHIRSAEQQLSSGSHIIRLNPGAAAMNAERFPWFTKGTVIRAVRFVTFPKLLERIIAIDSEVMLLDEALGQEMDDANSDTLRRVNDGSSDVFDATPASPSPIQRRSSSRPESPVRPLRRTGSRSSMSPRRDSMDDSNDLASYRQRALQKNKTLLRREQGVAFARAQSEGFTAANIQDLIAFADCFGAERMKEACTKFATLLSQGIDVQRLPGGGPDAESAPDLMAAKPPTQAQNQMPYDMDSLSAMVSHSLLSHMRQNGYDGAGEGEEDKAGAGGGMGPMLSEFGRSQRPWLLADHDGAPISQSDANSVTETTSRLASANDLVQLDESTIDESIVDSSNPIPQQPPSRNLRSEPSGSGSGSRSGQSGDSYGDSGRKLEETTAVEYQEPNPGSVRRASWSQGSNPPVAEPPLSPHQQAVHLPRRSPGGSGGIYYPLSPVSHVPSPVPHPDLVQYHTVPPSGYQYQSPGRERDGYGQSPTRRQSVVEPQQYSEVPSPGSRSGGPLLDYRRRPSPTRQHRNSVMVNGVEYVPASTPRALPVESNPSLSQSPSGGVYRSFALLQPPPPDPNPNPEPTPVPVLDSTPTPENIATITPTPDPDPTPTPVPILNPDPAPALAPTTTPDQTPALALTSAPDLAPAPAVNPNLTPKPVPTLTPSEESDPNPTPVPGSTTAVSAITAAEAESADVEEDGSHVGDDADVDADVAVPVKGRRQGHGLLRRRSPSGKKSLRRVVVIKQVYVPQPVSNPEPVPIPGVVVVVPTSPPANDWTDEVQFDLADRVVTGGENGHSGGSRYYLGEDEIRGDAVDDFSDLQAVIQQQDKTAAHNDGNQVDAAAYQEGQLYDMMSSDSYYVQSSASFNPDSEVMAEVKPVPPPDTHLTAVQEVPVWEPDLVTLSPAKAGFSLFPTAWEGEPGLDPPVPVSRVSPPPPPPPEDGAPISSVENVRSIAAAIVGLFEEEMQGQVGEPGFDPTPVSVSEDFFSRSDRPLVTETQSVGQNEWHEWENEETGVQAALSPVEQKVAKGKETVGAKARAMSPAVQRVTPKVAASRNGTVKSVKTERKVSAELIVNEAQMRARERLRQKQQEAARKKEEEKQKEEELRIAKLNKIASRIKNFETMTTRKAAPPSSSSASSKVSVPAHRPPRSSESGSVPSPGAHHPPTSRLYAPTVASLQKSKQRN